ncbi:putative PAS domain, RGS domain, PAS domain superfamily, RGS domain superfamily, RGS, subdomain 2 [Septoria linicola]|nr:putative PAS domain, RGS domain, PAS domain superfamily, RGS domain superfamily, RGS, subdomain 2 [Septoria linicola]
MAYNCTSSLDSEESSSASNFNFVFRSAASSSSSQSSPHEDFPQTFGNGKSIISTTHVRSQDAEELFELPADELSGHREHGAERPNRHNHRDLDRQQHVGLGFQDQRATSRQQQSIPVQSLSSSEIPKTAMLPASRRRSVQQIAKQAADKPYAEMLTLETFLLALSNPPVRYRLQEFCRQGTCCDYISFLDQVQNHRNMVERSSKAMAAIQQKFLTPSSPDHIDLSTRVGTELGADIDAITSDTYPGIAGIFDEAEAAVQGAIYKAFYPDFVRAQLMITTTEAMGCNIRRFKGLGDCFCLTDPSKADNPILFASDGFVSVTGYSREEIMPRNCRFLQGPATNSLAVEKIKQDIKDKRESVEFLLNYRKNGEPFWNLLYTSPLFDANGRLAFYIGGQVNCSSAIHGKQDIMKILATIPDDPSSDQLPDRASDKPTSTLKKRVEQVKSLQYRHDARVAAEPGIESALAVATRGATVMERVTSFKSAYSKYFVAEYPSLTIRYSSQGLQNLLDIPTDKNTPIIGSNALSWLKSHMITKERSNWKSRIEQALKQGDPISLALDLQTRRSVVFRGDERLMVHWTPMKDVKGAVAWVVGCLAPVIAQ